MTTKGGDMGTSQNATRAQKSPQKTKVKKLAEDIEIPEVPIPHRILIAHKKHLADIKRVLK